MICADLPPNAGAAAQARPTRPERSAGRADAAERSVAALDPYNGQFRQRSAKKAQQADGNPDQPLVRWLVSSAVAAASMSARLGPAPRRHVGKHGICTRVGHNAWRG
jgi:hypothetical protein